MCVCVNMCVFCVCVCISLTLAHTRHHSSPARAAFWAYCKHNPHHTNTPPPKKKKKNRQLPGLGLRRTGSTSSLNSFDGSFKEQRDRDKLATEFNLNVCASVAPFSSSLTLSCRAWLWARLLARFSCNALFGTP